MNPHCRLYVLLAREAPVGAILRRGPSRQVRLIKWLTDSDTFKRGQWFKGRVHERRCDLSPDGALLVFFAAKHTTTSASKLYSWTAVSRPPNWTALALWPKRDSWHGGGVFIDKRWLWLNHHPRHSRTKRNFDPGPLKVTPNPSVYGEDGPVSAKRFQTHGWRSVEALQLPMKPGESFGPSVEIWARERRGDPDLTLYNVLRRLDFRRPGGPYVEEFRVVGRRGEIVRILEADWCDWDYVGDLVWSLKGRLYRWIPQHPAGRDEMIADFTDDSFSTIAPTDHARRWPKE